MTLRLQCCGKFKTHGEALNEEMPCGDRGRAHRSVGYWSEEASLARGPPIPPAPADSTRIRTAQLNSFGISDPQNHEQK